MYIVLEHNMGYLYILILDRQFLFLIRNFFPYTTKDLSLSSRRYSGSPGGHVSDVDTTEVQHSTGFDGGSGGRRNDGGSREGLGRKRRREQGSRRDQTSPIVVYPDRTHVCD